jgi:hypothetical protein
MARPSRLVRTLGSAALCVAVLGPTPGLSAHTPRPESTLSANRRTYVFVLEHRLGDPTGLVGYVLGSDGDWDVSWAIDYMASIHREEHGWVFAYRDSWRPLNRVGYGRPRSVGLWVVKNPPHVYGYLKRGPAGRWQILDSTFHNLGYTRGPDGIAAGVAFLILRP